MEVVGEETIIRSSMSEPINVEPISIVKGKRTKRQRALSPVSTFPPMITTNTTTTSSSSGGAGGGEERGEHEADHILTSATTTTTSFEFLGESTEEEEDMANCLILLAQGYSPAKRYKDSGGGGGGDAIMEKFISRRFTEAATTTNGKAGFYVYECKTCNRCFPSFQALGGHRASHKKPKALEKKALMLLDDDHNTQFNGPSLSLQMSSRGMFNTSTNNNNNKSKVHECSICGSEFSSGQALGGHMRRHRTTNTTTISNTTTMEVSEAHNNNQTTTTNNKTKSVLSLDLNLPAPEQDDRAETKFPFNSKLFSASSSLVDCHY